MHRTRSIAAAAPVTAIPTTIPTAFSTAIATALASTLVAFAGSARAADWSDTALSVRYGTAFAEPFDNNADGSRKDIKKTIVALTHADGYKYGSNFFNVDILLSDHNDPSGGVAGNEGAQEAYIVYRHTLDIGKAMGKPITFGPVRGAGFALGFDLNTKNDGYASKKRMLVWGPQLMFDVPGFLNLSALVFNESNAPQGVSRYTYKAHGALEVDWGLPLPVAAVPLAWSGYALYIGAKGTNEFGGGTAPETHVDTQLMLDVGQMAGLPKHTALVGVAYEYWKNKFGNSSRGNTGATARTPMIRAEYHF